MLYYSINLGQKSFSVDLALVDTWMKANAGELYSECRISESNHIELLFTVSPDDSIVNLINDYWNTLSA